MRILEFEGYVIDANKLECVSSIHEDIGLYSKYKVSFQVGGIKYIKSIEYRDDSKDYPERDEAYKKIVKIRESIVAEMKKRIDEFA